MTRIGPQRHRKKKQCVDWIHLAENKEKSLDLVNAVLNLQVGNLFIS
jgi:hypothetical protein